MTGFQLVSCFILLVVVVRVAAEWKWRLDYSIKKSKMDDGWEGF